MLLLKQRRALLVIASAVLLARIAGQGGRGPSQDDYVHMQVYSEVLYHVRVEYVDEPNMRRVVDGSLHGLLESLDANSSYLSAAEYRLFKEQKTAGSANIGAFISKRFGYAAVVSVIPGGPAAKAGIGSGDIIEAIEGKSSHDMSLAEIRTRLAGPNGSRLECTVIRARKIEPQKIVVVRSAVVFPPVRQQMLANNIGYIQSFALNKGKAQAIAVAIKSLERLGATRLVLDLRDSAGGDEDEGVALANLFLKQGLIGYLEGQKVGTTRFEADPQKTVTDLPLVVLVNRGTAGPAELAASAIPDSGRGDLVGDKTFGDGSTQKLVEIPDGSALILSIAKYYTAKGKVIQENGINPNVEVASADDLAILPDDEAGPSSEKVERRRDQQRGPDVQLQKGLELLQKKPAKSGGRP